MLCTLVIIVQCSLYIQYHNPQHGLMDTMYQVHKDSKSLGSNFAFYNLETIDIIVVYKLKSTLKCRFPSFYSDNNPLGLGYFI